MPISPADAGQSIPTVRTMNSQRARHGQLEVLERVARRAQKEQWLKRCWRRKDPLGLCDDEPGVASSDAQTISQHRRASGRRRMGDNGEKFYIFRAPATALQDHDRVVKTARWRPPASSNRRSSWRMDTPGVKITRARWKWMGEDHAPIGAQCT